MPVWSSRNMLDDIINRLKLPFRKEKELYLSLRDVLGFYPNHIELYRQALMHKSAGRREKGKPVNNERLEFLGDAILGAVVGDVVFHRFEGKREGFLTNTRSKIVQRETLNQLAQEMGVTKLIQSKEHSLSHNNYMGGNAFEALVGAIYLDKGYDTCMKFMKKRILDRLINLDKVAYKEVNFKSKLIEWSQKNKILLEFRQTENFRDKEGSPVFGFQVYLEGLSAGNGKGYSKKEGHQKAAKATLELLRKDSKFLDSIFAAKGDRTKMEEQPVGNVPTLEPEVSTDVAPAADSRQASQRPPKKEGRGSKVADKPAVDTPPIDEFDLSDITATPQELTKEDVIAAAEAAAFSEGDGKSDAV